MKLIVLMEDSCVDNGCDYEHGLSVYTRTKNHRILVDAGASGKTLSNARKLDIDLSAVDTMILSHGHYDHSGGILPFSEINKNAEIYMQKTALSDFYHGEKYIGIDKNIARLPHLHLMEGSYTLDEELSVISNITGRRHWPKSNLSLSEKKNGMNRQDCFEHEQCLVIHGKKSILISGCAHNGILNILDKYHALYGKSPDMVLSGFHMAKKGDYTPAEEETIRDTAKELSRLHTVFCTGHCTGKQAFDIMKEIMGDKLVQIYPGWNMEYGDW